MATKLRHQPPKYSTSDFVKFLRGHYTSGAACSAQAHYEPSWVHERTDTAYGTAGQRQAVSFDELYERRRHNQTLGFFSAEGAPYDELGEVALDANRLVLEALGSALAPDAQRAYEQSREQRPLYPSTKEEETTRGWIGGGEDDGLARCRWERRRRGCSTAGMSDIRALMRDSERRITAVRAGQCYGQVVAEQREARRAAAERAADTHTAEALTLGKLSSHFLLKSLNTEGVPLKQAASPAAAVVVDGATEDGSLSRSASPGGLRPGAAGGARMRSGNVLSQLRENSKRKVSRRAVAYRQQVEEVYRLMCILANMKSRMLKKRTPLSGASLAELEHDPSVMKTQHSNGRTTRRTSRDVKASAQTPSPNMLLRQVTTAVINDLPESRYSLKTPAPGEAPGRSTACSLVQRLVPPGTRRAGAEGPRLDTWEDLLNVNTSKSAKVARRVPPWVVIERAGEKASGGGDDEEDAQADATHLNAYHENTSLARIQTEQVTTRERLQRAARRATARVEAELPSKMRARAALLAVDQLSPLWEQQRAALDRVHAQPESTEEGATASWVTRLYTEAEQLGVADDMALAARLRALEALSRCEALHVALLTGRERLCLAVMSLPAQQAVAACTRAAAQFILSEVLEARAALVDEWVALRGLSGLTT